MENLEKQNSRYIGIQCLRAVAALLVMSVHVKFVMSGIISPMWNSAFGAIGVDVFFVISGFVIALSSDRPGMTMSNFLKGRFSRVLPYYYVMSLYPLYRSIKMGRVEFHSVWNSFMVLPIFDHPNFVKPLHDFGWSISFEVLFYCLFSFSLLSRRSHSRAIFVAVYVAGVVFVLSLGSGLLFFLRFAFSPFALTFCLGIMIYEFRKHLSKLALTLSGVLLFPLLFHAAERDSLGFYDRALADGVLALDRFFVWGIAAATVVIFVISLENAVHMKWPTWLVKLGDASYSLYLVQPLGIVFSYYIAKFLPNASNLLRGGAFVLFVIAVSLPLHRYIEQPITRLAKKLLINER